MNALRLIFAMLALLLLPSCKSDPTEEVPDAAPAQSAATSSRKNLKVGVLTILTGESASYGKYTKQGIDLAVGEVKSASIDLVYKDTKADPLEAVRVLKELAGEGVPVAIGPFTSTEVRAVAAEAERSKVLLVTSSATADDLSKLGSHVFMMLPPNSKQGSDQALYAHNKLSAKRAAILFRENPYGQTLRKAFFDTFTQAGGTIVADVGFPDGEESFRNRLKQIKEKNPEVVFIPAHDGDTGRILRQAREVNFSATVRFLGADGSMSATTLKLAGDAAEGAVFSNVASVSGTFDAAYKTAYSEEPNPYAASAYDTLRIIAKLAADGARTSDDFQQRLISLTPFDGATGITKFTQQDKSYWALDKSYRQFEVKNGQFVLIR